ncbi:MAG: asparagine synthase-related protein [Cyclobacteriaceae bacterium]|nr:MAG: asparagine synthase-related protein [Cyclobacteriaceae bacterium]
MIIETTKGRIHRTFFNANTGKVGTSLVEVHQGEPFSKESLAWYFSIGYVPGDKTLFENIYCLPGGATCKLSKGGYEVINRFYYEDLIDPNRFLSVGRPQLIREAKEVLLRVVEREFNANKNMALGLTGGLDSRLLLGALLDVTEAKNIQTFSWGYKNTYDYEIGRALAKKVGVDHISYDLNVIDFSLENLKEFGVRSDFNTNLFEQPPIFELERDFKNANIWYGVLGGTTSGSNLPISSFEKPESYFLSTERKRTGVLSDVSYSILNKSIAIDDVAQLMSDYKYVDFDLIDIYNHHERLIGHSVFFGTNSYSAPLASDEWISFSLSLPKNSRSRKRAFLKDLIRFHYPVLSKLPLANTKGLPLKYGWLDLIKHKLKSLDRTDNGALRKKFIKLQDLYKRKNWGKEVEILFAENSICGVDLKDRYEGLMSEVHKVNHWKTLELIFSVMIIHDVFFKQSK